MEFIQDRINVYCLPDSAYCEADELKRNPLDIDECPYGCDFCSGDCMYYKEG